MPVGAMLLVTSLLVPHVLACITLLQILAIYFKKMIGYIECFSYKAF